MKKNLLITVAIYFLTTLHVSAAATWTGAVSNNWGTPSNWNPVGVPIGTTDVTIPASPTGGRFPLISSGTYQVDVLTIAAGATIFQTGGTLQEVTNFSNSGTYSATGGTVEFLNGSNSGNFSVSSSTQFYNTLFDAGSNNPFGNTSATIKVAGSWTNNSSINLVTGGASTIEFNGTSVQTIGGSVNTNFSSLVINEPGLTFTPTRNLSISGNFSVLAGTLDLNAGITANRVSAGGTLTVANGATLEIEGNTGGQAGSNFPSNFSTVTLGTSSTVVYDGINTSTQSIYAATYGNLSLMNGTASGTATKNTTGNITVNGTLNVPSDVTLNMTTYAMGGTVASVTGTGKIQTQNTSAAALPSGETWTTTVEYNNLTGGQSVAGGTYANLVNSNTSGTNKATGAITVSNTLTLNPSDTLNMATNPLIVTTEVGTGTLKTQNTSTAPISAGDTWQGPVYYNSASAQTIVNGNYADLNSSGGSRTLSTSGQIGISDTFTPGTGTYTYTGSTVNFNGPAAQNIPAFSFDNLSVSNGGTKTATGPVNVYSALTITAGNLASNGNVTLKSNANGTAWVAPVTTANATPIVGNVWVERYALARRAYRFLTAPVTSTSSIKANWMENSMNPNTYTWINPNPGYGTEITGAGDNANGFDPTAIHNPSMFTFDNARQGWVPIPNTTGKFTAGNGYRIILRGDRSIDMQTNTPAPNTTTLRASGALTTGTVTMASSGGTTGTPVLTNTTGYYNFIANPYACSILWTSVMATMTNLDSTVYIYDPLIAGSGGRGAYVSYNGYQHRKSISSSLLGDTIQSGQAFFVQTTGPNPSITFKETYKLNGSAQVYRTENNEPFVTVDLQLPSQINSVASADATAVYFSDNFNNKIGPEDSYKFTNLDENIAIVRNGIPLSLEGRKPVTGTDSIPLKIWQLSLKSYALKIAVGNFADNVEVYVEDKYLKTATPLAPGETTIPFDITTDTASGSANRFTIRLETLATLPVRLTGIKAYEKNKGVQVEWVAESESNLDLYEVERSADAKDFISVGSAKAKNNPTIASAYDFFDARATAGNNYYRIKSIEKSGEVKFSEVVRVQLAKEKTGISVVNNPVMGNSIQLLLTDINSGNYMVRLINATGEKVYEGKINNPGGTNYKQIDLDNHLAKGIYELQISNGTIHKTIAVLMQ